MGFGVNVAVNLHFFGPAYLAVWNAVVFPLEFQI